MRHTWLATFGLLLAACAAGSHGDGGHATTTELGPFSRFDHVQHRAVLEREGWSCPVCHAVGAVAAEGVETLPDDAAALRPPTEACHACHRERRVKGAPQRCRTCHEPHAMEAPANHALGWESDHGREANLAPQECALCHEQALCVGCHVRRDEVSNQVHPGTWIHLHGVAARSDPLGCEQCHEGHSCVRCHEDPEGRQGW